jgi:hypothetical protein
LIIHSAKEKECAMTASPAKPAWTDSGIPVESNKDSLGGP